nr:MAG TPA: hypothetical protein [Caudoviricetes sp.]DAS52911.1 MAG TPA: hypothetical protein [Caudoviricetes sp.]
MVSRRGFEPPTPALGVQQRLLIFQHVEAEVQHQKSHQCCSLIY